jgi:prephenate dehydrogenase
MQFGKITIIGLGLIGGSLAWALKKSGGVGQIIGVDSDPLSVWTVIPSQLK